MQRKQFYSHRTMRAETRLLWDGLKMSMKLKMK